MNDFDSMCSMFDSVDNIYKVVSTSEYEIIRVYRNGGCFQVDFYFDADDYSFVSMDVTEV